MIRRAMLLLLLTLAFSAQGAAPPVSPETVKRDLEKAELLNKQAHQRALAGRFADARKVDQESLRLRARWLPEKHRLVQASKQDIENWSRLVDLPGEKQKQLGNALRLDDQAEKLWQQGQYKDAEKLLKKALETRRKLLGEEHADTAQSYNSFASCLNAQGHHGKALPLLEKALAICRKVLGEEHADTARSYFNNAGCLNALGLHEKALPLYEKALVINRKVLGEEHPDTADSYNGFALCLDDLGQHGKALPLYEKALSICRKVLGEDHADTANSYNNVAFCLYAQGQHGKALPLFERALEIRLKVLGNEHPDTAGSYNNVASCLAAQGQHGKALPSFEKALMIFRKVLGEEHSSTAIGYSGVADCLNAQNQYGKALPLYEKALVIFQKVLGEEHPHTANSYSNVATCLDAQGQHRKALPLFEKTLRIRRKALGEEHPHTANSYSNVANCLNAQGQHATALPLFEKALGIRGKILGKEHPDTAASHNSVALCLWQLDRIPEAGRLLQQSLPAQEVARYHKADTGFVRALASRRGLSPAQLFALGLARLHQPANAFAQADASHARALLDDLVEGETEGTALARQLDRLDQRLLPLFGRDDLSRSQVELREQLVTKRREIFAELARRSAAVSARQLLPLAVIQTQIPQHAALVFWIDAPALNEYQACIVRQQGTPLWVRLTGSGKDGKWSKEDRNLHHRLYNLLVDPQAGSTLERQNAILALRRLRLEPLLCHLRKHDGLPAVRQLLVVPTGWAARVPLEVLTSDYRISYVPSASAFARLRQRSRPLAGTSLLALGDPTFTRTPSPRPETLIVQRGPDPVPLPGARREVAALAALIPHATTLLGSDASEQRLDELIHQRKLKSYRLIHLATHGQVNWDRPELSSVSLARDKLPNPLRQAQQLKKVYTGELSVETIYRDWRDALDADLVVLSACVTGLGTDTQGDGMLGFAQAFLSRGARCVVLSRWQVNDDATALLMRRFYQNLLGKRAGLKKPLGRASALEEARNWLRNLSRAEAGDAVASLPRGTVKPLPGTGTVSASRRVPAGDKPYAHPYYWSAFVLIGDPD